MLPQRLVPAFIGPTVMVLEPQAKEGLRALKQLCLCLWTLEFSSVVVLEDIVQPEVVAIATKHVLEIVALDMNVAELVE